MTRAERAAEHERDRVLVLEAMWTAADRFLDAVERLLEGPTDRRLAAVLDGAARMRAIAKGMRRKR